jgi:hypothetical protein
MPLTPEQRAAYGPEWAETSLAVRERSGGRCECVGECGWSRHLQLVGKRRCTALNGEPSPYTGSKVVLTVAHLDRNGHLGINVFDRLKAMCQGCHLSYDRLPQPGGPSMTDQTLFGEGPIEKFAQLSQDGVYRYQLGRRWTGSRWVQGQPFLTFVMLNPSTADAELDDPTIRRCMGFARRDGYGGIRVVNLYALRTTRPVHLWEHPDPVGPRNNEAIRKALELAAWSETPVVCAWGANAKPDRVQWLIGEASECGAALHALHVTKSGVPGHPLYLPLTAELRPWP